MIIDDEEYKLNIGDMNFHCSLDVSWHYIGGKWKSIVLWYLRKGTMRFGALKAKIPDITDKMLSIQLKSLERDGLIRRQVFAEVPLRVEYTMTDEGRTLLPVLEELAKWGREKATRDGKMLKVTAHAAEGKV